MVDYFDRLFLKATNFFRLQSIGSYYLKHEKFQRLVKYATSTFLIFWVVKGPLIWTLSEVLHIWYLLSTFIVGIIISLIGFVLNEVWVWKKKQ